jgi:hypothetical protein
MAGWLLAVPMNIGACRAPRKPPVARNAEMKTLARPGLSSQK